MAGDTRKQLLDVIEHEAFDPILKARPERYSGREREVLADVQGATKSAVERYEAQRSADGVYREYKGDLSSRAAKKTSAQIESLGLPTLRSISYSVEKVARRAGLKAT
jgi:hypothetical protein